MNRIHSFLKRIRLVYRRSSTLTKAVVLSAVVLSMAALIAVKLSSDATLGRIQDMKDQAARIEYENGKLNDKIDALGSADSVEDIAKDNGMVGGNTQIITPTVVTEPEE